MRSQCCVTIMDWRSGKQCQHYNGVDLAYPGKSENLVKTRSEKSQRFWTGRRARKSEIRRVPKSTKTLRKRFESQSHPPNRWFTMAYPCLHICTVSDNGEGTKGLAMAVLHWKLRVRQTKPRILWPPGRKTSENLIEGRCVRESKHCRGKTKRKNYGNIGRKGPGQHSEDYPCFLSSLRRKQPSCSLTTMASQVKALQSIDIRKPISVIPWYRQTLSLQHEFVVAAQKGRGHFIL